MWLLLKLKSIIPYGSILLALLGLSYGWYWHHEYNNAQATIAQQLRENASCSANIDLLQSGVQRWKAAASKYDQQLKHKEVLVAKWDAESQKRLDAIRNASFSSNCNTAIQEGLGFIWDNNIP